MWYRKTRVGVLAFYLTIMLVFPPVVFAQDASDYFKQGVKLAESEDFRAALTEFQRAKKAGLDTVALKYNIAVAHYRLGHYEETKNIFTELTDDPRFRRIAYYNLGLIAKKQKNKSLAIRRFQQAYRSERGSRKNKKIKALAAEALKRLDAPLRKKARKNKAWKNAVSASLVSDSNVTRVNEDLAGVTGQSDTSYSISAYGEKWLAGGERGGVRFLLSAYQKRYNTQTSYDYNHFKIDLSRYDRLGSWKLRLGGVWQKIIFGGSEYQNLLSAEVRGRKSLSKNTQLRLRYKVSQINSTNPVYDYLGGSRQQLRIGTRIKSGVDRFHLYYQLELNDREDFTGTAPVFTSYSPTRHVLRVSGWWKFSSDWIFRLDGRYRASKYNDNNILASSATELREDTQSRISARLTKKLNKNWQAGAEYKVTDNNSSIDAESYNRFQAGVDIKRKF